MLKEMKNPAQRTVFLFTDRNSYYVNVDLAKVLEGHPIDKRTLRRVGLHEATRYPLNRPQESLPIVRKMAQIAGLQVMVMIEKISLYKYSENHPVTPQTAIQIDKPLIEVFTNILDSHISVCTVPGDGDRKTLEKLSKALDFTVLLKRWQVEFIDEKSLFYIAWIPQKNCEKAATKMVIGAIEANIKGAAIGKIVHGEKKQCL